MKKWVEALRSGKYKQTKHKLRSKNNGFCCLGVLCNLHAEAHPKFAAKQTDKYSYDGNQELPPGIVTEWAGLSTDTGFFVDNYGQYFELISLNDNGNSFKQIADIIEANYKENTMIPSFPSADDCTLLIVKTNQLDSIVQHMIAEGIDFRVIDADNKYDAINITNELYDSSDYESSDECWDNSGCEY